MITTKRIAKLQRMAKPLGRLRLGTYNGTYPKASLTWILTSPAEDYVRAAAGLWGGSVERWEPQGNGAAQWRVITQTSVIDAILPTGDPLSQSYELWSKGGLQRDCDGDREKTSCGGCLCRAEYGEDFHESAPKLSVCKMTTRLNLILPDMPDIGVWWVETHSYYAANWIGDAVDTIRAAVGPYALVPVRAKIEPQTKVSGGKTKQFIVASLGLRGSTAGQVLSALGAHTTEIGGATAAISGSQAAAIGGNRAAAITAGPARPDYLKLAAAAASPDEVRQVWNDAAAAGHLDGETRTALAKIGQELARQLADAEEADEDEELRIHQAIVAGGHSDVGVDEIAPSWGGEASVPAAEDEDALDRLWAAIVDNVPDGWDTTRISREFAARNEGLMPTSASEEQLGTFLQWLLNEGAAA